MLVLAIVLGTSSCSGESSFPIPPSAGAVDVRFADVCTAWANAACAFADRCPELATAWASHDQCVWRTTLECELVSADPNVDFDTTALRACAARDPPCAAGFPSLTECLPPGGLPDQSPCAWSASCHGKACGRRYSDKTGMYAMCGTCGSATPPCSVTCPYRYMCIVDNDGGPTCRPPVALGESCESANCQSGTCDAISRVCVASPAIGASCSSSLCSSCINTLCTAPNTFCDATGHCAAQQAVPYGGKCDSTGSVCVGGSSCIDACDGGTACARACQGPIPDGFPCDLPDGALNAFVYCFYPARCRDNQCLYPNPALCSR
jgi:hypothetical protein